MNPKLILVEGLPGAGKTTVAMQLKKQLEKQGQHVSYYDEGCKHPADMAWQAYLSKEEYHQFVAECLTMWMQSSKSISDDELIRRIELQSQNENGYVTIAYHNINFPDTSYESIKKTLEGKEIHRGKVSFERYREIHLQRWSRFCQNMLPREETVIFEGCLLKNHILEILCSYELSDEEIIDFIMELSQTVMLLQPKVMYTMTPNIDGLIQLLTEERKNVTDLSDDWFTQMECWVRNTRYGREHNLKDREGIVLFFEEMQRLYYLVLHKIGLPVTWILQKE